VPGTIEAEDFDHGGEGRAYHDNTINFTQEDWLQAQGHNFTLGDPLQAHGCLPP